MKLQNLMKEYFENDKVEQRALFDLQLQPHEVPVTPVKNEWVLLKDINRYVRKFEFGTHWRRNEFVFEILKIEQETRHDLEILLTKLAVEVQTYTHIVDDITELDLEIAQEIDNVYKDVTYYGFEKRRR